MDLPSSVYRYLMMKMMNKNWKNLNHPYLDCSFLQFYFPKNNISNFDRIGDFVFVILFIF